MDKNGLNNKLSRVDEAIEVLRQKLKLNENDPVEKVVEKTELKNHLNIFIQDTEPETKEGIWIKTADKLQIDKIVTDEMPFVELEAVNRAIFPKLNISSTSHLGKTFRVGEYIYFTPSVSSSIKIYRLHIPTWTTSEITSFPGKYLYKKDACVVEDDVYFMGNGTTSYEPNSCWKYNISTDTWTQLADMPGAPSTSMWSAVYIDGFIYMVGVKNTTTSYNDIYKYDIQNNEWSYVTSIIWTSLGNKRCLAHGKSICIFNMRNENGNNNGAGVQDWESNKVLYLNTETLEISTSSLASYKSGLRQNGAGHQYYGCVINDIYYGIYRYDIPSDETGNSRKNFQVLVYDLKEKKQVTIATLDSTMWTGYGSNAVLVPYNNIIFKFANSGTGKIDTEAFSLISKEYDDNTLIIMQGKNNPLAITTELFHVDGLAEGRILYPVFNVAHYTTEGGLNYKLNLYYGDGETWHNYRQ